MVDLSAGEARSVGIPRVRRQRGRKGTAINSEDFRLLRLSCGLTREAAAAVLRVGVRTVCNWENGCTRVPYSAFKLLRVIRGYELPGKAWAGFRLVDEVLWSPEGRPFYAHEFAYLWLLVAMARAFRLHYARSATAAPAEPAALAGTADVAGAGRTPGPAGDPGSDGAPRRHSPGERGLPAPPLLPPAPPFAFAARAPGTAAPGWKAGLSAKVAVPSNTATYGNSCHHDQTEASFTSGA